MIAQEIGLQQAMLHHFLQIVLGCFTVLLDCPSLFCSEGQTYARVILCLDQYLAAASQCIIEGVDQIGKQMLRQVKPEHPGRHVLDIRPDQVAMGVIKSKITTLA